MTIGKWLEYGDDNVGFGAVDMDTISHVICKVDGRGVWTVLCVNCDGNDIISSTYKDRKAAHKVAREIIGRLKEYELQQIGEDT